MMLGAPTSTRTSSKRCFCETDQPVPPYSFGQLMAAQPFELRILPQVWVSSLLSAMPSSLLRLRSAGRLALNHSRTSSLNWSSSAVKSIFIIYLVATFISECMYTPPKKMLSDKNCRTASSKYKLKIRFQAFVRGRLYPRTIAFALTRFKQ